MSQKFHTKHSEVKKEGQTTRQETRVREEGHDPGAIYSLQSQSPVYTTQLDCLYA